MKLGEKLQQLRRQSGLSQEQLAAQLTVSRQAVSKWELDETMPDTDNVIQLSRLFGVTCDYLLRDEVDEQGTALSTQDVPRPAAPGEAHLDESGWVRSATVLSLAVCAVGLLLALGGWFYENTSGPLIIGLIIQIMGLVLLELAVPRMGEREAAARWKFYMIACWLVSPVLILEVFWWGFWYGPLTWMGMDSLVFYDLLLSGTVTVALFLLRRRMTAKK